MMTRFTTALAAMATMISLAGCEPTSSTEGGVPQERPETPLEISSQRRTMAVGHGALQVPANCASRGASRNSNASVLVERAVCVLVGSDGSVAVSLWSERYILLDDAHKELEGASREDRRNTLLRFIGEREVKAFETPDPNVTRQNVRHGFLDGDGGVTGAEACWKFSFEMIGRSGRSEGRGRGAGLRCARFSSDGRAIEEIMAETQTFEYGGSGKLPGAGRQVEGMLASTLRFR